MEDLKILDNGGFEIEIVEIYEQNNLLRVITRCPFGEDNLGLCLKSKYIDLEGVPKWKKQVKNLLEKKYGRWQKDTKKSDAAKKSVFEDDYGIINIDDLNKPGVKPKKND